MRTLIGADLRRAARGRDYASRLFAILSIMRDLEAHVRRLMRRLRGGLTRLRVIDPLPEAGPALVTPCAAIARADTS